MPTQLGLAVLSSSFSPDEGLVVFSELRKARQCFVLENELHIIYQVRCMTKTIALECSFDPNVFFLYTKKPFFYCKTVTILYVAKKKDT